MESPDNIKPPENIKEVGIHIFYMSKDINEMKNIISQQGSNFIPRKEYDRDKTDIETRLNKVEVSRGLRSTLMWVSLVATTLISIFAVYELVRISQ